MEYTGVLFEEVKMHNEIPVFLLFFKFLLAFGIIQEWYHNGCW